jgi:methyl acetate hydrolase
MDPRQDVLDAAVARGDAPFLVGMVADAGGVAFAGAAGEAAPGTAAGPDTLLRMFSLTKAVAAVAAMVLVERGQLDLDAPVTAYLPEFARIEVLDGWDGETPRLRAPRSPVTVRHLATHTSGFAYTHWNAAMKRYRSATGLPAMGSGAKAALFYPLAADPGTAWNYGVGIDWLGLVIEAASGRPIEAVCAEAIFDPLAMTSTAFDLDDALRSRLARAWSRAADGGFAPLEIAPPPATEFRGMGDALYSTPADYLRFLRLFVGGGAVDGVRVLSGAATAAMLANQIGPLRVGPMVSTSARVSADVPFFPGVGLSHSLIGVRVEADVPGMRREGAQGWSGLLNLQWWVDPRAGIAALLATQTLPFMEPRFAATYSAFERAVYAA